MLPARHHYRLRRVGFEDYGRVRSFANRAMAASTPPRPLHVLLPPQAGPVRPDFEGVYVVEDMGAEELIVGAAATICHCDDFIELCGATVVRNGFGFQRILTEVRAYHADALSAGIRLFCVVQHADQALIQKMTAIGFAPWNNPDPRLIREMSCPPQRYQYLAIEPNGLQAHEHAVRKRGLTCYVPHRVNAGVSARLDTDLPL